MKIDSKPSKIPTDIFKCSIYLYLIPYKVIFLKNTLTRNLLLVNIYHN